MTTFPLEIQALIRTSYGILLLCLFTLIAPFGRIYFTSERYGGCLQTSKWASYLLGDSSYWFLMAFWMLSAGMFALGIAPLPFSFINFVLCHIFFIRFRWVSPLRGMGAPGFISHWLAALVFLLEYSLYCGDREGHLRDLVVLTFKVDYAVMMIDAGIEKILHGYPRNLGVNYGMANPAWGYWPEFFKKWPPHHWVFRVLNHCAHAIEILGGILMLFPSVQWLGGLAIATTFLFVKFVIRLGVLCDMLILMTLVATLPGGWIHQFLLNQFPHVSPELAGSIPAPLILNKILEVSLWGYIILLPLVKLSLYYNFYLKRSFPKFLQRLLETFTNTFGIILWRVFTIELIDYFVRVYLEDPTTGKRTLYTRFGRRKWRGNNRFLWVGESIMSVILFNTARYFSVPEMFKKRLLCYSRTMPVPQGGKVVFEYVVVQPKEKCFEYVPAKEYRVDPFSEAIEELTLNEAALASQTRSASPVRYGARPGSYAPT